MVWWIKHRGILDNRHATSGTARQSIATGGGSKDEEAELGCTEDGDGGEGSECSATAFLVDSITSHIRSFGYRLWCPSRLGLALLLALVSAGKSNASVLRCSVLK